MLYALFLGIAIIYNLRKFVKERKDFLSSLIDAKSESHREMILGHHFYIFVFEAFLSLLVAHFISDKSETLGLIALGTVYVGLIFLGFFLYRFFVRYVEKHTNLELWARFKSYITKELRVSFAIILLPMLIYSLINWTFQDEVFKEWGDWWFIGLLFNVIFVSVLTIVCSVIIMLRLIPNREISEPEYLNIIHKHLAKIDVPHMRVRWIETDIKNAFVVGLKLLSFSNQTMFIGRSLRNKLTMEEFDAVVAHELAHVANRHIHKRVIELLKNFISVMIGTFLLMFLIMGLATLYYGEDSALHTGNIAIFCVAGILGWFLLNYSVLFDTFRSQEFEADAYAVMVLGASADALESALRKLTATDELPEYLKRHTKKNEKKNFATKWLAKNFSTHPDLETRVSSLHYKMAADLPFNHYVSSIKRLRKWFAHFFQWKVFVPSGSAVAILIMWGAYNLKTGREALLFVQRSSTEEIMANKNLIRKINSRPLLLGPSLMSAIVKKQDPELIDYFLEHGASKGKTLVYLSQQNDFPLFRKYFDQFEGELTGDEYYLILRESAQTNFTEAYRYLVNAKHFEELKPSFKESVTRIHNTPSRRPASVQK